MLPKVIQTSSVNVHGMYGGQHTHHFTIDRLANTHTHTHTDSSCSKSTVLTKSHLSLGELEVRQCRVLQYAAWYILHDVEWSPDHTGLWREQVVCTRASDTYFDFFRTCFTCI